MAGGTSFEIDIPVRGSSAESAAAAVDALANRLVAASTAAEQAAAAVSAGEQAYARAESTADRAAKALEKVTLAADAQRGKLAAALDAGDATGAERAAAKLAALVERQREAAAAADATKAAVAAEAAALDQLRGAASTAADAQDGMSKALVQAKKVAEETKKAQAAAAGTGKAEDALDGLAKLSGPLGGTVMKVKDASEGFKKLSSSLGAAGPYAAVAAAFVAIAIGLAAVTAAAIVGVAKVTWWAIKLSDEQGVIAAEQKRLEKGFKKLFSGLKLDKFLSSMSSVVDLFDEQNAAGRAIKVVFESLFQPIVDGSADMIAAARTAFLKFEIMALKALIAIKPYGSTILTVVKVLGVLGAVLAGVLLVVVAAVAANLAIMATGIAIVVTAAVALAAGVVWLVAKFHELNQAVVAGVVDAFTKAAAWLQSFSLAEVGRNMLDGLINGILGAGPAVLKALGGVVQGAVDGAKKLLGIASPSKVFAEIGENTGLGMVGGVEGTASEVQGALETMVSPPEVEAASAAGGAGGGSSLNLAGATFNFYGVAGAEDAESRFGGLLTRLLEGDASQLGGSVPA